MAIVALATLISLGWQLSHRALPSVVQDFEECAEQAKDAASDSERADLMTDCSRRFAGRRKPGGGYTYYDFLQNRSFDIAGPNPTTQEQKEIDLEYIKFLDSQKGDVASVELVRKQNEKILAELDAALQPAGPPLVLTPNIRSASRAGRPPGRPKTIPCHEGPWSCTWAKLSSAVKTAFASSPRTAP